MSFYPSTLESPGRVSQDGAEMIGSALLHQTRPHISSVFGSNVQNARRVHFCILRLALMETNRFTNITPDRPQDPGLKKS